MPNTHARFDSALVALLLQLIDAGYKADADRQPDIAASSWLRAWGLFKDLFLMSSCRSIEEFDKILNAEHWIGNWQNDLQMALWNAGLNDPALHRELIAVCADALSRFKEETDLTKENWRRQMADCYFHLGEALTGEDLYKQWLSDDPKWGWGWIGWSDGYTLGKIKDNQKAEDVLRQGLQVKDVRDRCDILERLGFLCEDTGRLAESEELLKQSVVLRATSSRTSPVLLRTGQFDNAAKILGDFALSKLSAKPKESKRKVGRNDPCICGSRMKFKQCHGRRAK